MGVPDLGGKMMGVLDWGSRVGDGKLGAKKTPGTGGGGGWGFALWPLGAADAVGYSAVGLWPSGTGWLCCRGGRTESPLPQLKTFSREVASSTWSSQWSSWGWPACSIRCSKWSGNDPNLCASMRCSVCRACCSKPRASPPTRHPTRLTLRHPFLSYCCHRKFSFSIEVG